MSGPVSGRETRVHPTAIVDPGAELGNGLAARGHDGFASVTRGGLAEHRPVEQPMNGGRSQVCAAQQASAEGQ